MDPLGEYPGLSHDLGLENLTKIPTSRLLNSFLIQTTTTVTFWISLTNGPTKTLVNDSPTQLGTLNFATV